MSKEIEILKRAIEREKQARRSAEQTLEKKSYELFLANQELQQINSDLEATIEKRTQQLAQNEARFSKMVDSTSDLIYRGDSKGICTYANPTTVQKMGYSLEELTQFHYTYLVRKDKLQEVIAFYAGQLSQGKTETYLEFPAVTKNGDTIWLGQNVIFEYDAKGNFSGMSAIARDITEQKMTLTAIQRSEEKYRNIISNMNLGLLEVDLEERIIQTNQSFCDMIGYEEEELLGKVASEVVLMGENAQFMAEKNAMREQGISDAYEMRVKDKSGNIKWWLISGGPLYNDAGEQTGSIGIHLDITDQKKLQVELSEARDQAELSNRAKEVFLANMSHEIRTPMNGVMGMARQLEKSQLNTDQRFYLKTIISAAEHLMVILNDILDLSKIDAGKLQIEETQLNLNEVLERTRNILSAKAEEKGLRFMVDLDQEISNQLVGDPTRINQVLLNLAGNSVKFTESGQVKISCKLSQDTDSFQRIRFQIEDSGIGMSQKFIDIIFDKFSQENKSIARKYGGTGLGMSISKQLVELMGGNLSIASEKEKGTTVQFELTLEKSDAAVHDSQNATFDLDELKQKSQGKKVLVVEDNEMNQLVVSTSLDFIGLEYDTALNGIEALEKIEQSSYNLVLMDINMPKMGGIETTQIIRQKVDRELPIIALTANAMEGASKDYLKAGMNDCLTKPFVEDELLAILNKWLKSENLSVEIKRYDLSKIKTISRGNEDFTLKMLQLFATRVPEAMQQIKEAIEEKDLNAIYEISHRIKPSLNDMDVLHAKDQIKELESLAKENADLSKIKNLFQQIESQVNLVVEDIRESYLKEKT